MHVNKCSHSSNWLLLYVMIQYPPRSTPTLPFETVQTVSLCQERLYGSVSSDGHGTCDMSALIIHNRWPSLLFQQCPEVHLIAANKFFNRLLIQNPIFNALFMAPRTSASLIIVIFVIIISECCPRGVIHSC